MEWIVRITGKPKQRIKIRFDPQKELIYFIGQYKPSTKDLVKNDLRNGFIWYEFSREECPMNMSLETLQDLLFKVHEKMEARIKVHEDLSKSFALITEIEVPEVEE